jgi:hypothetical protein
MPPVRLLVLALPLVAALASPGLPAAANSGFCGPGPAALGPLPAAVANHTFVSTSVLHVDVAEACFSGTDSNGVETDIAFSSLSGTSSGNTLHGPATTVLQDIIDIAQFDATGSLIGEAFGFDDTTIPQITPGLRGASFGPTTMPLFGFGSISGPATVALNWTPNGPAQHDLTIFAFHFGRINFGDHHVTTVQPAAVTGSVVFTSVSGTQDWLPGLTQFQGDIQSVEDQNVAVSP